MKEMLPTNLKYAGHLIGLILICACCSNPQDNHRGRQDVRTIILTSERNDNPALLNSFFAYKHHIALETNDSCLLRHLSKIQCYKGDIYLSDRFTRKIYAFSKEGKFKRAYDHYGNGPGEYLYLTDFCIRQDTLHILGRDRWLRYTLDGTFLDARPVEPGIGLYAFPDDRLALNRGLGAATGGDSHYSYSFYASGKKIFEDVPFNPHLTGRAFTKGEGSNSFYTYDDTVFALFPFNDTIYTVSKQDGTLSPCLAISTPANGKKEIRPDAGRQEINKALREGASPRMHAFHKWGEYVFFIYTNPQGNWQYVLARENGEVVFQGSPRLDDNCLPFHIVPYESDNPHRPVMSVLRPESIGFKVHAGKSKVLDELARTVNLEDNPILVFYEPKFLMSTDGQ